MGFQEVNPIRVASRTTTMADQQTVNATITGDDIVAMPTLPPPPPPSPPLVTAPADKIVTPLSPVDTLPVANLSAQDEPDSTSNFLTQSTSTIDENAFKLGEDILVYNKDDRYYLGTIVAKSRTQCLIKFDDNTERWSDMDKVTKLDMGDATKQQHPMCVVCKQKSDKVNVCGQCGRGFHKTCATAPLQDKRIWSCHRCRDLMQIERADDEIEEKKQKLENYELPYNIESLTWDVHHRVNMEQIYCYCGKTGEWFLQMLQCSRCEQWFHDECIASLRYPLYSGDRFYLFVCALCNHGKEYLRRIEMSWSDVVHLLLFNLTAYNSKKYHDVASVIIPYAEDCWPTLQLPPQMRRIARTEIATNIHLTLKTDKTRFKCGREIKKTGAIWGLRTRIPPPDPHIKLAKGLSLNDCDVEKELLKSNMKLLSCRYSNSMPADDNANTKETGAQKKPKKGQQHQQQHQQQQQQQQQQGQQHHNHNHNHNHHHPHQQQQQQQNQNIFFKTKYKHANRLPPTRSQNSSNTKHNNCGSTKKQKYYIYHNGENADLYDSSDDGVPATLDTLIPVPPNFHGKHNPFCVHSNSVRHLPHDTGELLKTKYANATVLAAKRAKNDMKEAHLQSFKRCFAPTNSAPHLDDDPCNGEHKRKLRPNSNAHEEFQFNGPPLLEILERRSENIPAATHLNNVDNNRIKQDKCINENENDAATSAGVVALMQQRLTADQSDGAVKCDDDATVGDGRNDTKYLRLTTNHHRLSSGEQFTVKGKRFTKDGNAQYLIEWEGLL